MLAYSFQRQILKNTDNLLIKTGNLHDVSGALCAKFPCNVSGRSISLNVLFVGQKNSATYDKNHNEETACR